MHTRTLVLLGTLVVVLSAGVVSLDDGSSSSELPSTLSPLGRRVSAAKETPAPTNRGPVRVAGLMINAPVNTGADPGSDDAFGVELAFFGSFERTRLALELSHPPGGVLGIDTEASSVTRFTDDRGTDLRKQDDTFGPFEMMERISEDGRHMVFILPSDRLPAAGATRLSAAGNLAVRVATTQESFDSEEVEVQPGSTFSVGGYAFEITGIGHSAWGDGEQITLKTKTDTFPIVSYALVADGVEHELSPTMSMSGMGSWEQTLDVETLPEHASFRVAIWQDLDVVTVPFEVETSLGF